MLHVLLPLADIGSALTGIAVWLAGFLIGALALALVIAGYSYMFALDDHTKAALAKRAIGFAVVGAMIVALAVATAPDIVTVIKK